jgi:hypothetical protein
MPWVIPPWLAFVEFLGLTAKKYDEHVDDKATMSTMTVTTATGTAAMPTTGMAATMATMTKVTWMAMAATTTPTTTMTSTTMGQQRCYGNNDNGMTTMEQRQWNNDDVMVMGSQALCHPSEATINLCRQFGEESSRERDDFGGWKDRKRLRWKRLGGDHFIST